MLTAETKLMSGIILFTIVSIEFGGYFLLRIWQGQFADLQLTDFQKNFFKAGHAHAGVLALLALTAQIFIENTSFSDPLRWSLRIAFPLAALLMSGGFFAAAIGKNIYKPNKWVVLILIGSGILAYGLIVLGIGLLRS